MIASRLSVRSALFAAFVLAGCGENPAGPRILGSSALRSGADRQEIEFSEYNNFDIPLSCVSGLTHWEGWVHVTVTTVATPSGLVNTRIRVNFDPEYFVEIGGKQYHLVSFHIQEHHTDGKASNIAGTAAGVFRSDDGDTIPLGFHVQVVLTPNGNAAVDWKFTGACP